MPACSDQKGMHAPLFHFGTRQCRFASHREGGSGRGRDQLGPAGQRARLAERRGASRRARAGCPASLEGAGSPEGAGGAWRSRARCGCLWAGLLIYNRAELPGASAPLPSIKIIGTSLQRFVSREGSRLFSFFPCLAPSSLPHFQAHPSAFQPLQPRPPLHRPVLFPLSPSRSPRFLDRPRIYH